jgi:hypothetical protein
MYVNKWDKIEDQYFEWLCENCKCPNSDLGECECASLNEWFDSLRESAVASMDEYDLEEMYI